MAGTLDSLKFFGYGMQKDLHPANSYLNDQWTAYVIEMSDGVRPSMGFYPHRSLPIGPFIKSVNDYLVLPKGKIVSAVSQSCGGTSDDEDVGTGPNDWPMPSGGVPIHPSGTPPFAPDSTSLPITPEPDVDVGFSSFVSAGVDDYGGYPKEVISLLVPANGGITGGSALGYSDLDTDNTPIWDSGTSTWTTVDASSDTLAIPANKPIGILYTDAYRDITGRYLSWTNQSVVGVLTDWFISIPFVNLPGLVTEIGDIASIGTPEALTTAVNLVNTNPFYVLSRIWAFSYGITGDCDAGNLAPGSNVYSDLHGNYIFNSVGGEITEQKVGTLFGVDYRWPKQFLDAVDTFPGSGGGSGTETGGLPWRLFHFIQDLLLLCGVPKENRQINDIVQMVQDGIFGLAYINVHTS